MAVVSGTQSDKLKYENEFETETLYSIPMEQFLNLIMEEYPLTAEAREKVRQIVFYCECNRLLIVRKTNDVQSNKCRQEELRTGLEGKYVQHLHRTILLDFMQRGLIPEGLYVITP